MAYRKKWVPVRPISHEEKENGPGSEPQDSGVNKKQIFYHETGWVLTSDERIVPVMKQQIKDCTPYILIYERT